MHSHKSQHPDDVSKNVACSNIDRYQQSGVTTYCLLPREHDQQPKKSLGKIQFFEQSSAQWWASESPNIKNACWSAQKLPMGQLLICVARCSTKWSWQPQAKACSASSQVMSQVQIASAQKNAEDSLLMLGSCIRQLLCLRVAM